MQTTPKMSVNKMLNPSLTGGVFPRWRPSMVPEMIPARPPPIMAIDGAVSPSSVKSQTDEAVSNVGDSNTATNHHHLKRGRVMGGSTGISGEGKSLEFIKGGQKRTAHVPAF
jgi:hypothetical protein